MNDVLLSAVASAGAAAVLLFLGAWENDRRTRRNDARKEAAGERAALEAQANELVAAVLAVKVAGNAHDHLFGSWKAKTAVCLRAAVHGVAGHARTGQQGFPAVMAGFGEAAIVIGRWDEGSAVSAAALATPLGRLGAAVAPLMGRPEPGLAAAAEEVFTAIGESYADEARITRALTAFREALRPALEPPVPPGRRWSLRRRSSESGPQALS